MSTIKEALDRATADLSLMPGINASLEAGLLLSHLLNKDRSWLYAWPEKPLTPDQQQNFAQLVERRLGGEPIAYITGHREFWSLDLVVTPDTLIPRPETELLVSLALSLGRTNSRVLELGTGSGAIAIAIASECPDWQITATDQSVAALDVARRNLVRHKISNVHLLPGSWYRELEETQKFHIIVSNPPYVADQDPHLQQGDLRFEPAAALSSGTEGLDDLRTIIKGAPAHLKPGGYLLVEHGLEQGDQVRSLFESAGFKDVQTEGDIEHRERVTRGNI